MLTPLSQFYCDKCGQLIRHRDQGYVEWLDNGPEGKNHSFVIVHSVGFGPTPKVGCYIHEGEHGCSDTELSSMLDVNGLTRLYGLLDTGMLKLEISAAPEVVDVREYVEFLRRLTIPYYDEARRYFDQAKRDGFFNEVNEIAAYTPETMQLIIEKYAPTEAL